MCDIRKTSWEGRLDKFGEELGRRQKARVAMRKERIS